MRITKYGHACVLVEEGAARILIDPGSWNSEPDVTNLNAILITHEHADHCDIAQLHAIAKRNPEARVITHEAVAALLFAEGIASTVIQDGESVTVEGVSVHSCGREHAVIYGTVSPCRNTGYVIAHRLFVPGDALHDVPKEPVDILALPVGGPWMRLSEAIDYARRVKPKTVFPIHDAMYQERYQRELIPRIVGGAVESANIAFVDMSPGSVKEF